MRIRCPYCGERDLSEFSYRGDATSARPDPSLPDVGEHFFAYVYLRDNPAGPHREWWHHAAGCRSWLAVTRDTHSHEILSVETAS